MLGLNKCSHGYESSSLTAQCQTDDLEKLLDEYNWDDGFEIPKEILSNPYCDLNKCSHGYESSSLTAQCQTTS